MVGTDALVRTGLARRLSRAGKGIAEPFEAPAAALVDVAIELHIQGMQ